MTNYTYSIVERYHVHKGVFYHGFGVLSPRVREGTPEGVPLVGLVVGSNTLLTMVRTLVTHPTHTVDTDRFLTTCVGIVSPEICEGFLIVIHVTCSASCRVYNQPRRSKEEQTEPQTDPKKSRSVTPPTTMTNQ